MVTLIHKTANTGYAVECRVYLRLEECKSYILFSFVEICVFSCLALILSLLIDRRMKLMHHLP